MISVSDILASLRGKLIVSCQAYPGEPLRRPDITAAIRSEFGKGAARRIRREDKIPAVLYGSGTDPVHLTLPGHETMLAVKVSNALLNLDIEGRKQLALVKDVPAGQGVSYAHAYVTDRDTRLGLVPLGYADGVPRAASNAGPVLVNGRRLAIAGRVCMDQFMLDLGPASEAQAGDEVVLFGSASAGEPTAEDWAAVTGTISYEIVTRMSTRLPHYYRTEAL